MGKFFTIQLISISAIFYLLSGCTSNEPYHTQGYNKNNCSDPTAKECTDSYYQEYPTYDLAFAEFTERGNVFNNQWIKNILAKIRQHEKDTGVVMVVFVHGWKHNANKNDPNLIKFKEALATLSYDPDNKNPSNKPPLYGRKLVGVYVGWRGSSLNIEHINNITYWDRKSVAEEVGKGGISRLLLGLEDIYNDHSDKNKIPNVLVTVGHSFGGAIVVSAVSDILAGRISTLSSKDKSIVHSIGDAVIVLNPAIEANQALPMVEAGIYANYSYKQNPIFISISSDADQATHTTFPIGQTLGLLFTWHQADLERDYYHDRIEEQDPILKEEHLDTTTVGNFAPFLTHYLSSTKKAGEVPILTLRTCDETPESCEPKGLTTLPGQPTISPLPNYYPFYFIKTDKSIMSGHNAIFTDTIRTFLITLIDDIVRRNIIEKPATDKTNKIDNSFILSNPEKLNKNFKQYYRTKNTADE